MYAIDVSKANGRKTSSLGPRELKRLAHVE